MTTKINLDILEGNVPETKKDETKKWVIEVTPINRRQLVDIMKFRKWVNLATGKLPSYYDDEEKIVLKPIQVYILNRMRKWKGDKWIDVSTFEGKEPEGLERVIEYVELNFPVWLHPDNRPNNITCRSWEDYYWIAQTMPNLYLRQKMAGTLKEEWVQKVKDAGGEEWTV